MGLLLICGVVILISLLVSKWLDRKANQNASESIFVDLVTDGDAVALYVDGFLFTDELCKNEADLGKALHAIIEQYGHDWLIQHWKINKDYQEKFCDLYPDSFSDLINPVKCEELDFSTTRNTR